jgi:hypothetical protein
MEEVGLRITKKLTQKEEKEMNERIQQVEKEDIDEIINLEWWLSQYGETEMPAKFMIPEYFAVSNWDIDKYGPPDKELIDEATMSKIEGMYLTATLKELDGAIVNETHVWKFKGLRHYKRDGPQNHFACVPLDDVRTP